MIGSDLDQSVGSKVEVQIKATEITRPKRKELRSRTVQLTELNERTLPESYEGQSKIKLLVCTIQCKEKIVLL